MCSYTTLWFLGRPFVKRFALCYRNVVLSVLSVGRSVTLVYCGQTVGWIKMKLGMEVGLGPGHNVLDGDPAPTKIFGPCLLWPIGWMYQDATGYGDRPRPRRHCVRWGPRSPSPNRGGTAAPTFRPMSVEAKRLDGSRCHFVGMYTSAQATLC